MPRLSFSIASLDGDLAALAAALAVPRDAVRAAMVRLIGNIYVSPAQLASPAAGILVDLVDGPATDPAWGVRLELADAGVVLDAPTLPVDEAASIVELIGHVLAQLVASPRTPLAALDLVPPAQRARLATFNATSFADPMQEATIAELFASAVARHPDALALTFADETLTYAQLGQRVEHVASRLHALGVGPNEIVAINLAASLELIVVMLAILRAGGAYLPIDPHAPADRARYMIEDSGARVVIDRDWLRGAAAHEATPTAAVPTRGDAAYLIYTSGTTGAPKGVVVEHHSVVNYVTWFRSRYGIDHTHIGVLLTSHAYDLGYTVLWTTLLSGGHLHLVGDELARDPSAITRYVHDHGVTFLKVTPSLLGAILTDLSRPGAPSWDSVRLVVSGGERIRPADLATVVSICPNAHLVNHYGPTETTIGVTTFAVEAAELPAFTRRPVIGRPIGNTQLEIVTPDLRPLPIGALGELLVTGEGVARGYHRREDLTAQRFVTTRFGRAYRTGDLARWTCEGTIEFVGRVDRQLKVRGYRIEATEVEHALLTHASIREVVVVDRMLGDSNHALCAYYTAPTELDLPALRAALRQTLPEYMIPMVFHRVEALPRNANGKLDLHALPAPRMPAATLDPTRTETERSLAKIWANALGIPVDSIGATQNFFELGGHSLLMIQVIADVDDVYGRTLDLHAFYGEGTIRALATLLDGVPDDHQ